MSEPILKALIQLFALIGDVHDDPEISGRGKDIVRLFLAKHLSNEQVLRYMAMFDEYVRLYHPDVLSKDSIRDRKRTSLTAMRILAICEKINEELQQKQKIYVLVQLMDFISFSTRAPGKELEFLETVATAFNVETGEYRDMLAFILVPGSEGFRKERMLVISSDSAHDSQGIKHLYNENLRGRLLFLNIASTNTLLMRYEGRENLLLNGQIIFTGQTYVFEHGSSVRGAGINPVYFNDVEEVFVGEAFKLKVSLDARDISLRFRESENGVQKLSLHEESGRLVGIMGGSGVGKSTLLNLLSGIARPDSGNVFINGHDLNTPDGKEHLRGVIGFVPQDDLLFEELTVFQNLYYNARMCLNNLGRERICEEVNRILADMDLYSVRDLKVGSPVNKVISGGQRKRLNIALELIREPTILFVDEPTSGLSSVDAETVMNMLKEQAYRGRLVIATIHQPGSDIYKMFDRIMILDKGGYLVFHGNPTETVVWFRKRASLANPFEDQCIACGHVDTDQLLRIIETRVVNEFGKPTPVRRVSPAEWAENFTLEKGNKENDRVIAREPLPGSNYSIPGPAKQALLFFKRDLLSKVADRQYMLIALLGAPLLAVLLAFFTRNVSGQAYRLSDNENLPAYMFMCVITAFFMGLILSAEEIVRDRRILKRESFLNLSWFSYINSKIIMMFLFAAIQTGTFVLAGNLILGIKGMTLTYWIILFSASALASLTGLNISSAFNSVVTIYILIPFIIIPQLLFSGVLVKFDSLHRSEDKQNEYVPVLGELMPARWAYEALVVEQYRSNKYENNFFDFDTEISQNNWYSAFLAVALRRDIRECILFGDSPEYSGQVSDNLNRLGKYFHRLSELAGFDPPPAEMISSLSPEKFNPAVAEYAEHYLDSLAGHFKAVRIANVIKKDSVTAALVASMGKQAFIELKENNTNRRLREIVLDEFGEHKIVDARGRYIQKYEPAYMKPVSDYGRAHFYAPYKKTGNAEIGTLWFNLIVLWLASLLLYAALYLRLLKKAVNPVS